MNYWSHVTTCIITAITISIAAFNKGTFGINQLELFLVSAVPYTFVITCDLDSAASIPTKILNKLHVNIFKPFVDYGHRQALHHYFWGPIILIGWWLIPVLWVGKKVPIEAIEAAVLMIWCHIICDAGYSGYKKLLKLPGKYIKKIRGVL